MYLIRECREKGSRRNCGQILHVAPGIFFNRKYVQLELGQILHVAPGKLYNRKCYWSSVRLHFLLQVYFHQEICIVGAGLDSSRCSRYTFQQDKCIVGAGLDSLRCSRCTFQQEMLLELGQISTCYSRYTFQQEICTVGAGLDYSRCSRYTFQQEILLELAQILHVAPGILFNMKLLKFFKQLLSDTL